MRAKEGATYARLAEEFGVTTATISYHVRRAGVPSRASKVSQTQARSMLKKFYEDGLTIPQLADEFGVSRSTVRSNILREPGVGKKLGRFRRLQKVFPPVSPTDCAYLAAMIDGEGCIHSSPGKNRRIWHLTITNTSEDLRRWLERIGGQTYFAKLDGDAKVISKKQCFAWKVTASWDLYRILEAVHPYLIIKKARAQEAMRDIACSFGIPPDEESQPERLAHRMLFESVHAAIRSASGSRPRRRRPRSNR